jgi:hypothetical protein
MQFLGMTVILIFGGICVAFFGQIFNASDFQQTILGVSPWVAAHLEYFKIGGMILLMFAIIAVPPLLMKKDVSDGGERLETVGLASLLLSKYMVIGMGFVVGVIALGFFFGTGIELSH